MTAFMDFFGYDWGSGNSEIKECENPKVVYKLSKSGDPTQEVPVCQRLDVDYCHLMGYDGTNIICLKQAEIDLAEGCGSKRILLRSGNGIDIVTEHVAEPLLDESIKGKDEIKRTLKDFLEKLPFGQKH